MRAVVAPAQRRPGNCFAGTALVAMALLGLLAQKTRAAPSAIASAGPASASSGSPMALRVGPRAVSLTELQQRLNRRGAAHVDTAASGWREAFAREVVARQERLDAEVLRRKLASTSPGAALVQRTLVEAMEADLEREAVAAGAVTDGTLRGYYDRHLDRFEQPLRLHLWRIRLTSDSLARKILEDARGAGGVKRWRAHARKSSLDAATRLRGGDLGMVYPSGLTAVPRVKVNPALYAAALRVQDGELVPEPVQSGRYLAVVWRRGSLPPMRRPFASVRHELRRLLLYRAVRERRDALLERLRKARVSHLEESAEILTRVPLALPRASASATPLEARPASAAPVPALSGGLLR